MTELFLVRHGQASFGAQNYDELSPLGFQQSRWLGAYFKERQYHFSKVWSGSLIRHQETAQGILTGLEQTVTPCINDIFNEFDFQSVGKAYLKLFPQETLSSGATPTAFYRLLKKAMLLWSQNKLDPAEIKESWSAFQARVALAIDLIKDSEGHGPVLVVSSGGAIAMFLSLVLGLSATQVVELNMQIRNTSFSHFYFNQDNIRLSSFNNVPHMDIPERLSSITFS